MKTTITRKVTEEIEIAHVLIQAPINYGEEDIPNDFPLRFADTWIARVQIDTGKIESWPQGRAEKMFVTVKDSGTYTLLSSSGARLASIDEGYVPHGVVPGQFGDTIELTINADGVIANWPKHPDVSRFFAMDNDE